MFETPLIRFAMAAVAVVVVVVAVAMVTGRLERNVPDGRRRARGLAVIGAALIAVSVLAGPLGVGSGNGEFGALQIAGSVLGIVLVAGRHAIAGASAMHGAATLVWIVGLWAALSVAPAEGSAVEIIDVRVSADRSVVDVTVPFQGGCAQDSLDMHSRWRGNAFTVWLTRSPEAFECLAACIGDSCIETVRLVLDEPIPLGAPIEVGVGLGLNSRTGAAAGVALVGFAAGYRLWSRGRASMKESAFRRDPRDGP